jgi:hypothetical protein
LGRTKIIAILLLFAQAWAYAQNNKISVDARLADNHRILLEQEIFYVNHSEQVLDSIYLLNWANAYRDRNTPLAERLIEDYRRSFYFSKKRDRGYSRVSKLSCNGEHARFGEVKDKADLMWVELKSPLAPGDSIRLNLNYEIKVPKDKYTRYGQNGTDYNLRYWCITPAVFEGGWQLFSNLNMDDYFMEPTDYDIRFSVPMGYTLNSNLPLEVSIEGDHVDYFLLDKARLDVEVNIQYQNDFSIYDLQEIEVHTNLKSKNLTENLKADVLQRQLDFISSYLGPYPYDKILVNQTTYLKHPVYGFNQLPKSMNPFSDVFEWDIKMFKAMTDRYIDNTILVNKREENWLPDGIQIYLMMEYVDRYYPEVKAIGDISKKWFIRNYSISDLDFNGKYPFVLQFTTRKVLDQSLTTRSDSLSNLNLKLVNRYKSALGLRYLDYYLQDSIVRHSLQEFYREHRSRITRVNEFERIIREQTDKDLDWFFGDYVNTTRKIDHTIKKTWKEGDSVKVVLKNKTNYNVPITLYGIDHKQVKFKKWIEGISDLDTVTISGQGIDRLALNYEFMYPENNLRDNWKKIDPSLFNRPVRFRFLRDIEDPYYNQVFFKPYFNYNLYDGVLLGPTIYNQALFKKTWLFSVSPVYGFKSHDLLGSINLAYEYLPEETSVYRYRAGLYASRFHYDNDLAFNQFFPFVRIDFKRRSLRDVGGRSLITRWVMVDKDLPPDVETDETYKYNVFNVRYGYSRPDIIKDLRYFTDIQYGGDFSKFSLDVRYRKLTSINRHLDFRVFFGTFLHNRTETDFFSFALDRPSDYLFDLSYLGRSEESGFLSQQTIIAEGGFKTMFPDQFVNQWLLTTNVSASIWRWIEVYADAGYFKNKGENAEFRYDTGIRLNFIPNFLEVYFPLQSSLGFEPEFSDYASRIRFVFTIDFERIYNLVKRGFY